jgi:crotonobetainyl-CoA:carnitine CoA-transferase CaiB-like acyl-CoA transferase
VKKLPLEGIRVADLTMMWAGPYGSRILALMGAEVIKVESPRAWDNIRTLIPQPGAADPWNSSYYFNYYNNDKKSFTLDLSMESGRATFLELIGKCDVVLENYRADVMDNLRLGYDVLREAREDIIMVSMAGFGKTGAERNHVGFGPIIEQMSGLASLSGYGDGMPMKTGISYGDPIAGLAAAGAVALALIQRRKTGKGTFVDLSQRETSAALIGEHFVAASLRDDDPVHRGNRSERYAPQGAYACRGNEQWLVISITGDDQWASLCEVIGTPELAPLSSDQRSARHDEIDAAISRWTATQDPQVAMENLQLRGIAAGRVLDSQDIHDDPNLNARKYWIYLDHPRMTRWRQPQVAWRLVEANPQLRNHAPFFGQHNRDILSGLLGKSEPEITALYETGVCSDAPVNPGVG